MLNEFSSFLGIEGDKSDLSGIGKNMGSNIKRDSMGCILKPKESPCD
jgi:hypothetical protein